MKKDAEVIIGAGLLGLTAARVLKKAAKSVLLLEASDVGDRLRTDEMYGILLDRAFQVFLTAYPEAQRFLEYRKLQLCKLDPGAMIFNCEGITKLGDHLRQPGSTVSTLFSTSRSIC